MTRPVLAAVHALDRLLAQPRTALAVFVPAGLTEQAAERHYLDAFAAHGTDVFEVGIPHPDAVLDGEVVRSAYQQALRRGTGITDVLRTVEHAASRCPVVVMSYWASIQHHGPERLATALADAGAAAVMVPDLPPDASRSRNEPLPAPVSPHRASSPAPPPSSNSRACVPGRPAGSTHPPATSPPDTRAPSTSPHSPTSPSDCAPPAHCPWPAASASPHPPSQQPSRPWSTPWSSAPPSSAR
ncbi:hypothetical protein G4Z16_00990 [Streptomyces bathyalis]|uniref:tryptophan synthase n=1 Tax=Streptomyces bathyalis TaxID=2710756 RepID=A0A7T1T2I9_9ACTN|nr:tryptophan synthase subunit alpha [Streptomyces bathyalis]QPP05195.1 hypothetical protein G4Z16_00990 [Streptomyces bathyalis]